MKSLKEIFEEADHSKLTMAELLAAHDQLCEIDEYCGAAGYTDEIFARLREANFQNCKEDAI